MGCAPLIFKAQPKPDASVEGAVTTKADQAVNVYRHTAIDIFTDLHFRSDRPLMIFPIIGNNVRSTCPAMSAFGGVTSTGRCNSEVARFV